jgi:phenylacetate-CoA ligase
MGLILPGSCLFQPDLETTGRMHLKIDSILGRTDDIFIIRGVNITPQHLKAELMRFPEVGQSYQIVVEGYDELIGKVELDNIFHYTIIKHRG